MTRQTVSAVLRIAILTQEMNNMKLTKNLGMLLLAIYLILVGVSAFVSLGQLSIVVAILAIAAGILILLGR